MKHLRWLPFAAALFCAPLHAGAMTADELVAKNLAAHGGAGKLHALKTARWTGKVRFGGGGGGNEIEADYVSVAKRPGKTRNDTNVQGFNYVYAWDGHGGWKIEPGSGRKDAERLSADDSKSLVEDADFEGWLVDYKAKGHKVEYLGTEDVDGTLAHKLKLTRANGDFHYLFIDPDHFLEIRIETHRWVRGAEEIAVAELGEYENVGGTFWPYLFVLGHKGTPERTVVTIDKLEFDVPVDDAAFQFPETPKKK